MQTVGTLLLAILVTLAAGAGHAKVTTIAVVRDGPSAEDELLPRIEAELNQFVRIDGTVRFKEASAFNAGWEIKRARSALQAALNDPEVDLILGLGSLVTYEAARPQLRLTKPFASAFIQRADVLKLPYSEEGRSLKKNFSFIVAPQRAERDLEQFRDLVRFRTLHVAVGAEDLEYAKDPLVERLKQLAEELRIDMVAVPVSRDVDASLSRFDSGVRAVYITRLPRFDDAQRTRFIQGLTSRGIPSFSMLGHADVERGALAALVPDQSEEAVRRVALNLTRLSRGESAAELPVILAVDTRLLINGQTAQQVGYSPSPEVWIQATFLHREALQGDTAPLTYAEALESAARENTRLSVQESTVESARQSVVKARSPLLPQVLSEFSYLDSDTPLPNLQGLVPEKGVFFGLVLSQSIYNDKLWTLFRTSKHGAKATEYRRDTIRLDVMEAAGATFMGLGLARALQGIQAANVELTEDFLELARLRVDVGITGKEDVLLWTSVLARHKSALFRSSQRARTTQLILNQIMGVEQSRAWTTRDLSDEWETFFDITARVLPVLEDMRSVERFRESATEVAVRNAPEMAAIEEVLSAQNLRLRTANRSFWMPSLAADFAYLNELAGDARNLPGFDEDFWVFGLKLRFPLLQGGGRFGEKGKAQADVIGLEREQRLVAEQIELRTRTVVEAAEGIYPRIQFSRDAADAARENLRIVRDQYGEGAKNITDLLSAQNNLIVAEELQASAVYEFLIEMVKLQRSLSWFEYGKTEEQRDELLDEFQTGGAQPLGVFRSAEAAR